MFITNVRLQTKNPSSPSHLPRAHNPSASLVSNKWLETTWRRLGTSQSQRPNPHKSGYFLASFVSQPLKLESRNAPRGNGEHCVTQVRAAAKETRYFWNRNYYRIFFRPSQESDLICVFKNVRICVVCNTAVLSVVTQRSSGRNVAWRQ